MGVVVELPTRRDGRYEAAGLDRLLAELDRRRGLHAVRDERAGDARTGGGTVVPFRLADR